MKVLITGATGLLGKKLCKKLRKNNSELTILSRNPSSAKEKLGLGANYFEWHPEDSLPPSKALENIDAVIHLAGESISGVRWTPSKKERIYNSRILSTRNLVKGIIQNRHSKIKLFISASAVGYYGDTGNQVALEDTPPGTGFLADVCKDWENEASQLESRLRVALLRTGLVMSPEGGVFTLLRQVFKLGLGAVLGDGKQWISWIHDEDWISSVLSIIQNPALSGPVNLVSPNPVTNREFTDLLGKAIHRPTFMPAPRMILKGMFGEMSQLFLESSRVTPHKLLESGYSFKFPTLKSALVDLIR